MFTRWAWRRVPTAPGALRRWATTAASDAQPQSAVDKVGREVKLVALSREARRQARMHKAASGASAKSVRTMSLPSRIALAVLVTGVTVPVTWNFLLTDKQRASIASMLDDTPVGDAYAVVAKQVEEWIRPWTEPSRKKLLPDWPIPQVPPDTPPVPVLILDLEDTLVHSEWSRKHGWRHAKRPGVDEFLEALCPYFEIVVFSQNYYADEIVEKLDPKRCVLHVLSRDATRYYNGAHVKDLANINRDLRQVVIIDDDPAAYQLQPENAIPIKPYTNGRDREDSSLKDLIPFLKALALERVPDFRRVLEDFRDDDGVIRDLASKYAARLRAIEIQKEQEKQKGLGGFIRGRLSQRPPAAGAAGF